jgi:phospholipid/cholesterol/gamma-HCH transport system substrate-binding protein
MPRREGKALPVGAFVALALLVLAVGIMAVGGESRVFSRKAHYRASFKNVEGLRIGSPVKMAGVQVGTVAGIQLPTDPHAAGIDVRIGVERAYAGRVRQGSQAAIRFLQWLSGEKFIEVVPGDPTKPELPEDAVIPTMQETAILEQGEDIAENLNDITVSLKAILEPMQRGEGLLGQMLKDPNFGKEGLAALKGALTNVEVLTDRLRRGQGFAGKLFFDPSLGSKADDLTDAIGDLAEVTKNLRDNKGALGDLLKEGGKSDEAVADLAAAAASLRRTAEALEHGDGLVGRLLHDKEYSERVGASIAATLHDLAEIMHKINTGQGTLGALVNERKLHEGLEQVVAGTNDSKFARWLMRHYQKKGIEVQTATPPQPTPAPPPNP